MAEIPKNYEPQAVEAKWYQFWLDEKCFVADAHSKKAAYSIVIPPPNVTGILHMGHVLNNTIQDILARKARMEIIFLPDVGLQQRRMIGQTIENFRRCQTEALQLNEGVAICHALPPFPPRLISDENIAAAGDRNLFIQAFHDISSQLL